MKTIIDTAAAAGLYTHWLAALKTAVLTDMLRVPGPYTVFVPSDASFAALSPSTMRGLLKDMKRLKMLLTYHVVSGRLSSRDLTPGPLRTVEGGSVVLSKDERGWLVNGIRISTPDVTASNGFIHVIDAMMLEKLAPLPEVA